MLWNSMMSIMRTASGQRHLPGHRSGMKDSPRVRTGCVREAPTAALAQAAVDLGATVFQKSLVGGIQITLNSSWE